MMLATTGERTIDVHCPLKGCDVVVPLEYTETTHEVPSDDPSRAAYVMRVRIDHGPIDAHIRSYHGTDILA